MFNYVSAEKRVPPDYPLRAIRGLVDDVLLTGHGLPLNVRGYRVQLSATSSKAAFGCHDHSRHAHTASAAGLSSSTGSRN